MKKALRKVTLSKDQVSRLNHLRERGGAEHITKQQAEELLSTMSFEDYQMTMARIGD